MLSRFAFLLMGKELKAEEGIKVLKCPKGKRVQTLASRVFPVPGSP
jgi:hypothetical protein